MHTIRRARLKEQDPELLRQLQREEKQRYKSKNPEKYQAQRRKRSQQVRLRNKTHLNQVKAGGCTDCDEKRIAYLHFHHRDPATKKRALSKMLTCGFETLKAEVAKCDVLCGICHTKRELAKRDAARDTMYFI